MSGYATLTRPTLIKQQVQTVPIFINDLAKFFANRSKAIQEAIKEKLSRVGENRLEVECAKLNCEFEQALSEEGIPATLF
jgi:hypothetical protein